MVHVSRWSAFALVILALAPLGCRNQDLVEMELRARDIQYREALEELGKAEYRNDALQREIETLRKGAQLTPEQAAQTFGLTRIVLARGTGGYDDDGLPGDEALQVVLEPRDADHHIIKSPGTLQVMALEISPQGIKTCLSTWTIEPYKLRRTWKQGLLSNGYQLVLPWQTPPQTENLRIVARLVLSDGRMYETDKDVKVRLLPGIPRRPEVPPELTPTPGLPGPALPGPALPGPALPGPALPGPALPGPALPGPALPGPALPGPALPGPNVPGPALIDPLAQPAAHRPASQTQANWQPAPLNDAVQLGRPVPIAP